MQDMFVTDWGEGAYYYFIREDKCIPYYRNFTKINQLY